MSGTFKIGRIRGIQIELHYTWLFALVFVASSLAVGYYPINFPEFHPVTDWVLGLLSALLLFGSVLIHELSHSAVAMARGLRVRSITLFIFGGVSNIAGEPRRPKDEFAISLVGPLISMGLAASLWAILGITGPAASPANALIAYLALVNLVLGAFNLMPGLPLDGGRVLRSIIWAVTHNLRRATNVASLVGQAFGFLLVGWGLVQIFGADVFSGMWTAVLGWFLNNAAKATRHMDLMDHRPLRSVSADMRLTDALKLLAEDGINEIWVTDGDRVVGLLRVADLPHGRRPVRGAAEFPFNGLEEDYAA